jgi:hypothetical protein
MLVAAAPWLPESDLGPQPPDADETEAAGEADGAGGAFLAHAMAKTTISTPSGPGGSCPESDGGPD